MMSGVQFSDSERWILKKWIKPDEGCGEYEFCEIDVARARLIRDLRDDMEVNGTPVSSAQANEQTEASREPQAGRAVLPRNRWPQRIKMIVTAVTSLRA
jgi:hypothetical protein